MGSILYGSMNCAIDSSAKHGSFVAFNYLREYHEDLDDRGEDVEVVQEV